MKKISSVSLAMAIVTIGLMSCNQEAFVTPESKTKSQPDIASLNQPLTESEPADLSFNGKSGVAGLTIISILTPHVLSSNLESNVVLFTAGNGMTVQAPVTHIRVVAHTNMFLLTVTVPTEAVTGKVYFNNGTDFYATIDNFIVHRIPVNGLVAFYPFDGNAKDVSNNNIHGTVNGATLTSDRNGINSNAYAFNSNTINLGNPLPLRISGSITLSCWLASYRNNGGILGKGDLSGNYYYMSQNKLPINSWGKLLFYATSNLGSCPAASSGDIIPYVWTLLTVTKTGTQLKYYKDGQLVLAQTGCLSLQDVPGDFKIGFSPVSGYFSGKMDNVAIYNRALNDDEVMKLYQNQN